MWTWLSSNTVRVSKASLSEPEADATDFNWNPVPGITTSKSKDMVLSC